MSACASVCSCTFYVAGQVAVTKKFRLALKSQQLSLCFVWVQTPSEGHAFVCFLAWEADTWVRRGATLTATERGAVAGGDPGVRAQQDPDARPAAAVLQVLSLSEHAAPEVSPPLHSHTSDWLSECKLSLPSESAPTIPTFSSGQTIPFTAWLSLWILTYSWGLLKVVVFSSLMPSQSVAQWVCHGLVCGYA